MRGLSDAHLIWALCIAACGAPTPAPSPLESPAPSGATSSAAAAVTFPADPLPRGALRRYGSYRLRHRLADSLAWVGGHVVSADSRAVEVWDPKSGARVASHDGARLVVGSPRDDRFAAASYRTLRIHDVHSGSEKLSLDAQAPIRALAYSGDGTHLAVLDEQGEITVVDSEGSERFRLSGPDGYGAVVALDDNGTTVVAGHERTLVVWRDGQEQHRLALAHGVSALTFSPGGLVVSGNDGTSVYDVDTGQALFTLGEKVGGKVLAASATLLAVARAHGEVVFYDGAGRSVGLWQSGRHEARALAFSPDGTRLAALVSPGVLRIYDTGKKRDITPREAHEGEVRRVAMTPDGRFVVSLDGVGYVCVWNREGALMHRLKTRDRWARALALSPDGKRVAVGDGGRWVYVYDLERGRLLASTRLFAALYDADWSPDGKRIAFADGDGDVWLLDEGLAVIDRIGHGSEARGVAFSPDGRTLATAGSDAYLELWDLDSGLPRATLLIGESPLDYARFSPDGSRIAVGWYDRLQIHDVRSGLMTLHLEGIGWDSLQPAWSPDGKYLAAAGQKEEAYLIDTQTGAIAERIAGHRAAPRAFAFTPDGRELLTAADDTTLLAWSTAALPDSPNDPPDIDQRRVTPPADIANAPALPTRDNHRPACATAAVDRDGTPLPHCAIARMGTRRFRVQDGVSQLAYAPDGSLAAGGDWETSLLFDANTGRVKRRFWHESMGLASLAFSPDGDLLAGATSTDGVRVWRVRDGSLQGFVPTGWVYADAMAFSPDGDKLFVGKGKRLFVHDLKHRQRSFTRDTTMNIARIFVSDDGARLLVSSEGEQSPLVSTADGEPVGTSDAGVHFPTLLPGGGVIGIDGDFHIVTGPLGSAAPTDVVVDHSVDDLRLSADGSTMALFFDEHVDIYDTRPLKQRARVSVSAEALALSFDGRWLATALGPAIDQWDTRTGQRIAVPDGHRATVTQVVFDGQGRLVTAADDVRVWDASGKLIERWAFGDAAVIVLSADGERAVFIREGKWYRWERQSDQRSEITLEGDPTCVGVTMSADAQRLACRFYGEGVTLFDSSGRRLQRLLPGEDVMSVVFHPDGRQIAAIVGETLVVTGAGPARRLGGLEIARAMFSRDGATLYAMTDDDRVLVLDSGDLRLVATIETREAVEQMALSPSGEIAVMLARSGDMEIWDMNGLSLRYRLAGEAASRALAFSPDGKRLAVGGEDTTALVFDATRF